MRILVLLPLTSLLRHLETVVVTLAERGHEVRVVTPGRPNDWPLPETVAAHPRISKATCPDGRTDQWAAAATHFRLIVDYAHYLTEPFAHADKLRARALEELQDAIGRGKKASAAACGSCGAPLDSDALGRMTSMAVGATGHARVHEMLRLIETVIPSDPGFERYLASERPELVLVTPLVGLGSDQADWVKSAQALGIPVGFPVFSWDNLTTKGLIHVQPDRVFVWNDIQRREAIELHGVPEERITITGAPRFDAFVDMGRAKDRGKFADPHLPLLVRVRRRSRGRVRRALDP
jgi:hypothetical protein